MKQPKPGTCYPTAVSMLTGIPYERLVKLLGHDGSKVIKDHYEGVSNSAMTLELLHEGWHLIQIDALPLNEDLTTKTGYPSWDDICKLVNTYDKAILVVKSTPPEFSHTI